MTVRIKNTADDRTKHLLHRTASRFELEPILGDKRIRLGTYIDVDDEYYERVKHLVAPWIKNGMVEVFKLEVEGNKIISSGSVAPMKIEELRLPEVVTVAETAVSTQTLSFTEPVAVTETVTVAVEPAPVVEEAPAPAPMAVEEKASNDSKKGPGKKKLF